MKKSIIVLAIVGFLIGCLIVVAINYNNPDLIKIEKPADTNYIGLVKLGLAPSAPSRRILEDDIDTGIIITNGKNSYSLIKSRTFVTKDYGKTFVTRIE